jgi:hypothetical protein
VQVKASLTQLLRELEKSKIVAWAETGINARPNLHGILRYPAMMVPSMQGDILDTILGAVNRRSHVIDPFVGSGTILTEALTRDLDFTGIDINPLAALVCEAKAGIDSGADIEGAAQIILSALRRDVGENVDVDFPNLAKWFSNESAIVFSRIRRSIIRVNDAASRKVMWTVFAETIRLCSNSRTSTYKLHIRAPDDQVDATRVTSTFELSLRQTLRRVEEYRMLIGGNAKTRRPKVKILCDDARSAKFTLPHNTHRILITSPPYGDNQTTIPYGQFSYLALKWIPECDLPGKNNENLTSNTHALDTASLGGSNRGADLKQEEMREISKSFDRFVKKASRKGQEKGVRKVAAFAWDFYQVLKHMSRGGSSSAHWVITTGNRTAAGISVPFDLICDDLIGKLGGKSIAVINRKLPNKRMPSRNSEGKMITTESTLIAEFS